MLNEEVILQSGNSFDSRFPFSTKTLKSIFNLHSSSSSSVSVKFQIFSKKFAKLFQIKIVDDTLLTRADENEFQWVLICKF